MLKESPHTGEFKPTVKLRQITLSARQARWQLSLLLLSLAFTIKSSAAQQGKDLMKLTLHLAHM